LRQLPFARAPRVVRVGADALAPQPHHLRQVGTRLAEEEDVDPGLPRRFDSLALHGEDEALDAGTEADRGCRRAADLLHEVVVAAAARQRRLRAALRTHELPGRSRVVV